jgi:hypothetical protein
MFAKIFRKFIRVNWLRRYLFSRAAEINNLMDQNIACRETASTYLKSLCEIGVLQEEKIGCDKIFIHPKFMRLLTGSEHMFERYR